MDTLLLELEKANRMMKNRVLICTATSIEAKSVRAGITKAGLHEYFEILQTGMGSRQATRVLQSRLKTPTLPRPWIIISTGFAGSQSSVAKVGSWVMGSGVES